MDVLPLEDENNSYALTRFTSNVSDETKGGTVLILSGLWQNDITAFISVICLFALVSFGGIILNTVVVVLMVKTKRYQTSLSNLFITHLAVVDLIFRIVCLPPQIYLSAPTENSGNSVICKVVTFVMQSCGAAMFGTLVVIALDRYQKIVHPLKSLQTKTKPSLVVLLVWVYSFIASAMFLYTADMVPLSELAEAKAKAKGISSTDGSTSCDVTPGLLGGVSTTVYFLLTFMVPMTILAFTYSAILFSLRRRAKRGLAAKAATRSKAKSVRMLLVVVGSFVLCWGPSVVLLNLRSYGLLMGTSIDVLAVLTVTSITLQLCSSLANPLVYAFYNSSFKKGLIDTLRCRCCKFNQKVSTTDRKTTRL